MCVSLQKYFVQPNANTPVFNDKSRKGKFRMLDVSVSYCTYSMVLQTHIYWRSINTPTYDFRWLNSSYSVGNWYKWPSFSVDPFVRLYLVYCLGYHKLIHTAIGPLPAQCSVWGYKQQKTCICGNGIGELTRMYLLFRNYNWYIDHILYYVSYFVIRFAIWSATSISPSHYTLLASAMESGYTSTYAVSQCPTIKDSRLFYM